MKRKTSMIKYIVKDHTYKAEIQNRDWINEISTMKGGNSFNCIQNNN